jgi:hypothetical protein
MQDDVLYRRLSQCLGRLLDGATIVFVKPDGPRPPRPEAPPRKPGTPIPQGA